MVSSSRVLFPQTGFTTNDLIRTYQALAPVLLPHLTGRPISFRRYPASVEEEAFWEKDAPGFTPPWVRTVAIPRTNETSDIQYIVVEDERTLAWAASVGCIEIHPFLHRYTDINCPTSIIFDLDPRKRRCITLL